MYTYTHIKEIKMDAKNTAEEESIQGQTRCCIQEKVRNRVDFKVFNLSSEGRDVSIKTEQQDEKQVLSQDFKKKNREREKQVCKGMQNV